MTSCFGIGTAHVESAEGIHADKCAGAFTVEIEITDKEIARCLVKLRAVLCIDGSCQTVLRVVGNLESFLEILNRDKSKYRSEYLFLREACHRLDVGDDGRF